MATTSVRVSIVYLRDEQRALASTRVTRLAFPLPFHLSPRGAAIGWNWWCDSAYSAAGATGHLAESNDNVRCASRCFICLHVDTMNVSARMQECSAA